MKLSQKSLDDVKAVWGESKTGWTSEENGGYGDSKQYNATPNIDFKRYCENEPEQKDFSVFRFADSGKYRVHYCKGVFDSADATTQEINFRIESLMRNDIVTDNPYGYDVADGGLYCITPASRASNRSSGYMGNNYLDYYGTQFTPSVGGTMGQNGCCMFCSTEWIAEKTVWLLKVKYCTGTATARTETTLKEWCENIDTHLANGDRFQYIEAESYGPVDGISTSARSRMTTNDSGYGSYIHAPLIVHPSDVYYHETTRELTVSTSEITTGTATQTSPILSFGGQTAPKDIQVIWGSETVWGRATISATSGGWNLIDITDESGAVNCTIDTEHSIVAAVNQTWVYPAYKLSVGWDYQKIKEIIIETYKYQIVDVESEARNGELSTLSTLQVPFFENGEYKGISNAVDVGTEYFTTSHETKFSASTDPNKYANFLKVGLPQFTTAGQFTNVYAVTSLSLTKICDWLWYSSSGDDTSVEFLKKLQLTGADPTNAIVSLQAFPFNVKTKVAALPLQSAVIVGYNIATDPTSGTQITGYPLDITGGSPIATFDFGVLKIYPKWENFLDYEPYTAIQLYIPFCGFVELTPSQIIDRFINVKLFADIVTGTCLGVVYLDRLPLCSKQGQISQQIPITGVGNAQYQQALLNNSLDTQQGLLNLASAGISAISSMAMGNVGGVLGSAIGGLGAGITLDRAKTNRDFIAPQYTSTGSYTANNSLYMPLYPYFQITRATVQSYDNETYGNVNGFAVNDTVTLGQLTGYAEFADVNLDGIQATAKEIQMIHSQITSGVYL